MDFSAITNHIGAIGVFGPLALLLFVGGIAFFATAAFDCRPRSGRGAEIEQAEEEERQAVEQKEEEEEKLRETEKERAEYERIAKETLELEQKKIADELELDWAAGQRQEFLKKQIEEAKEKEDTLRYDLKSLLEKVAYFVDRGYDDDRTAKAVANKLGADIPAFELLPMIDAAREALNSLESKQHNIFNRFSVKQRDHEQARIELFRGNPIYAVQIMEERLKEHERAANAAKDGNLKSSILQKAGDMARHLAVLTRLVDIRRSALLAEHAVSLEPLAVKSLDVLGYLYLNINEVKLAERAFFRALEGKSAITSIWDRIAHEGAEIAKSLLPKEVKTFNPMKHKNLITFIKKEEGHER